MITRYYHILLSLALALIIVPSAAGQTNSLYFLQNIPESNDLNPSLKPNSKWYIGVPGFNSVYFQEHNDITYSDALFNKAGTDSVFHPLSSPQYFDKFMDNLEETSLFNTDMSETILRFGFKVNKGYFHFSNSIKTSINYKLPKEMFAFVNGFENNGTIDLSTLGVDAVAYHEFAFGYSHDIMPNLTVGARFKILRGIYGIETDISEASLYTSTDYWQTKLDATINMSAPVEVIDEDPNDNKIDDIEAYDEDDSRIDDAIMGKNNPGFAVDFGAEYTLNEKWRFSASVLDLGSIKWDSDLNNLHYTTTQTIDAMDIDVDEWEDLESALDDFADEIEDELYSETSQNSFKTRLATKLYLGAAYDLTPNVSFGVLSNTRFYEDRTTQNIMLSSNLNAYKWLTSSVSYNLNFDGPQTLGLALGLNVGAVQFYMATDYLYYKYDKLTIDGDEVSVPQEYSDFRVQFGMNLVFGRRKASKAAQVNPVYNKDIPGSITY